MTKRIDSDALGDLTKALGLTGRGAQITELMDGVVDQVLDVGPIVRRGRTPAGGGGIFTGVLENNHPAADSETSSINPYNPIGPIAGFLADVPAQFDVWILGAFVTQLSGTGTLSAVLDLQYDNQGWGVDDTGAAVVANPTNPIAFWDALATEGFTFGLLNGARGPFQSIGLRIPRVGVPLLTFRTTSSAAAVFRCNIIHGLFPIALGQDGLV